MSTAHAFVLTRSNQEPGRRLALIGLLHCNRNSRLTSVEHSLSLAEDLEADSITSQTRNHIVLTFTQGNMY